MERSKAVKLDNCNEETLDMISRLHDPILHIIMQKLMEEKDVLVQTRDINAMLRCLSKKFKKLCDSMPYLRFDDCNFPNIESIVSKVMLRHEPYGIHTFDLALFDPSEEWEQQLITWTTQAVSCKVKKMELLIIMELEEPTQFPSCIFTSTTLEELKLSFRFTEALFPSGPAQLKKLKKLHLDYFCDHLPSYPSLKNLISRCPLLEELELERCVIRDLDLSSNTLKRLSIRGNELIGQLITISCPILQFFCLSGNNIVYSLGILKKPEPEVFLGNFSNLVEAIIQIDNYQKKIIQIDDRCCNKGIDERRLSSLTFSSNINRPVVQALPLKFITSVNKSVSNKSELPLFGNLKNLRLQARHFETNFATITRFIQSSPNLEVLNVNKTYYRKQRMIISKRQEYECPHFRLKFTFACGDENEKIEELMDEFVDSKCNCPLKK